MAPVHLLSERGLVAQSARKHLEALGHQVLLTPPAAGNVTLDLGSRHDRRDRWSTALASGAHVVSASLDPRDQRWGVEAAGLASNAGLVILPCSGMGAVLGDLLASRAAAAAEGPTEVHTAHLVADRGGLRRAATPGLRHELAGLAAAPAVVRTDGRWVDEQAGVERRLAWFARPVGPHHAANVPAPEVLTIVEHVPTALTVRGHLAMATWQAEVLQALSSAAHKPRRAARLERRVERGGMLGQRALANGPEGRAQAVRWATVAEARGERGVARAWANGRDLVATTGAVLAAVVDRVTRAGTVPGSHAPALLPDSDSLLDDLAAMADLRWSVVRPGDQD